MGRLQFEVSPAGCCASAMVARTRLSMCQEQGLRMLPQGSQLTQHNPQPQWRVRLALRASVRRLAPLRRAAAGLPMLQLGPPASASRGASSRGRSRPSGRATGGLAPGGARGQEGEVRTASMAVGLIIAYWNHRWLLCGSCWQSGEGANFVCSLCSGKTDVVWCTSPEACAAGGDAPQDAVAAPPGLAPAASAPGGPISRVLQGPPGLGLAPPSNAPLQDWAGQQTAWQPHPHPASSGLQLQQQGPARSAGMGAVQLDQPISMPFKDSRGPQVERPISVGSAVSR